MNLQMIASQNSNGDGDSGSGEVAEVMEGVEGEAVISPSSRGGRDGNAGDGKTRVMTQVRSRTAH